MSLRASYAPKPCICMDFYSFIFDLMCPAIHFAAVMLKMFPLGLIKVYLIFY